jgi:hypothetical protein
MFRLMVSRFRLYADVGLSLKGKAASSKACLSSTGFAGCDGLSSLNERRTFNQTRCTRRYSKMAGIHTPIPSLKLNDGTSIPMVCFLPNGRPSVAMSFCMAVTDGRVFGSRLATEPARPGSRGTAPRGSIGAWWKGSKLRLGWDITILIVLRVCISYRDTTDLRPALEAYSFPKKVDEDGSLSYTQPTTMRRKSVLPSKRADLTGANSTSQPRC